MLEADTAVDPNATSSKPARISVLRKKYNSNEFVVNNKSSFKSQLVRCQKIIDNVQYDQLVLKSVGNATNRALNLAIQLSVNNFETFEVQPKEYSIYMARNEEPILGADRDGFDPDERQRLKLIPMKALDVVVRKNKLELDNLRKTRQRDKNRHQTD